MTVWKGNWKPDGTGGWHTKSDKDIVDQYNSARLTPAPAQMLKDAIDEVVRLREENEKLREENKANFQLLFIRQYVHEQNEALRTENEKLREALEGMIDLAEAANVMNDPAYDTARKTLENNND